MTTAHESEYDDENDWDVDPDDDSVEFYGE